MVNTFELEAFLRTESDDGALVSDYNLTPVEMLDKHTNMKIMANMEYEICVQDLGLPPRTHYWYMRLSPGGRRD